MGLTRRDPFRFAQGFGSTAEGANTMMRGAAGLRDVRGQMDQREQYDRSQTLTEQKHADSQEDLLYKRGQDFQGKQREAATAALELLRSGDPIKRAQAEALLSGLGELSEGGQAPDAEVPPAQPAPAAPLDDAMPPAPPEPTGLEAVDEALATPARSSRDIRPSNALPDRVVPPEPEPAAPIAAPVQAQAAPPARSSRDMVPGGRGSASIRIGDQEIKTDLGAADQRVNETTSGFQDTLNKSGVPTTAELPPELVKQALAQAGNDPLKARQIIIDEVTRRNKAKTDQLDRDAAQQRADSMAAARGESARGTAGNRESIDFFRGRNAATAQLDKAGARGRANLATDLRAAINRIDAAPSDPRVYASAIYGLARANEGPGARFTNQDITFSAGVMDVFTEARQLGEAKLAGAVDAQRMEDVRTTLADQLALVEQSAAVDYEKFEADAQGMPTPSAANGYEHEVRATYGRLPFYKGKKPSGQGGARPAPSGSPAQAGEPPPAPVDDLSDLPPDDAALLRELGIQ